jgi:hypothetical protein
VFVRLQPYKQLSLKKQGKNKLAPKFYGPFRINKKISKVTYGLEFPDNCCIHNVFHVSCLKKVLGKAQPTQTKILEFDDEGRIILELEGILPLRKRCYVLEPLRNISSNGKTFQKKIHHGSQNIFSDNTHRYPCFEDKEKS